MIKKLTCIGILLLRSGNVFAVDKTVQRRNVVAAPDKAADRNKPLLAENNRDRNLGLGFAFDHVFGEKADIRNAPRLTLHLRALNYTPLELYAELGHGFGTGLKIHWFYSHYFSVHFLDPGVYFPRGNSFYSRQDIDRSFDLVFGGGVDVFAWRGVLVSLGVRWMFPNPFDVGRDVMAGKYSTGYKDIDVSDLSGDAVAEEIEDRLHFLGEVYKDTALSAQMTLDFRWYW